MGSPILDFKKIKKTTEEFFEKFGFKVQIEVSPGQENVVSIKIKADDPQSLIGEGGQTLAEIQHILKAILRKKTGENLYLDLDINNYKEKKIEYLKELAREAADDVALSGKEKILPEMKPFERRVIHLELADRQDITTESVGEEPERKIIIKPKI